MSSSRSLVATMRRRVTDSKRIKHLMGPYENRQSFLTRKARSTRGNFSCSLQATAIESNVVARRRRGNAIAPCAVTCNTSLYLPRAMSDKNQTCLIGAIKLLTRILAIENIRTRGNVVAFNTIACSGQEKLPRVLRALRNRFKLLR
jgi:hypothetical protein